MDREASMGDAWSVISYCLLTILDARASLSKHVANEKKQTKRRCRDIDNLYTAYMMPDDVRLTL